MNAFATVRELRLLLEHKQVTPHEVCAFFQARLQQHHARLNCCLEVFDSVDIKVQVPADGMLGGIPYLVKDIICQKGHYASAASLMLQHYKAPYDATVIQRLSSAGAVSLGRANCDEFAMGASGETSAFGPARNPWDITRVPGGSSSGSAAAVAAGLVPFALGSETGGSIRNPASFCGLVGLYPTYGLHSRYGVIALASSFDQVCPLTKTVYDNALVTSALSGQDPHDATTIAVKPQDYTKDLDGRLAQGLTLGIIKDGIHESIDPQVAAAFDKALGVLTRLGAKTKVIDIPSLRYANAVYFIISRAEAASNLSRYDGSLYGQRVQDCKNLEHMCCGSRADYLGKEVKTRILTGNYVLSAGHRDAYYQKAQNVRAMLRSEFDAALHDVDLLVSPTMPILPFKLGEMAGDPVAMYLADLLLIGNNVIGYPALSLPCGYSQENLPIGMQFIGPRLSEALLYKTAHAFEQATEFHRVFPQY